MRHCPSEHPRYALSDILKAAHESHNGKILLPLTLPHHLYTRRASPGISIVMYGSAHFISHFNNEKTSRPHNQDQSISFPDISGYKKLMTSGDHQTSVCEDCKLLPKPGKRARHEMTLRVYTLLLRIPLLRNVRSYSGSTYLYGFNWINLEPLEENPELYFPYHKRNHPPFTPFIAKTKLKSLLY